MFTQVSEEGGERGGERGGRGRGEGESKLTFSFIA